MKKKQDAPVPEPRNKNGDWRIAITATLGEDLPSAFLGGPSHKAGSYLSVANHIETEAHKNLNFLAPHPAAMFLSVSRDMASQASILRAQLLYRPTVGPKPGSVLVGPESVLYEFFQSCAVSAMCAYQALEAYSNWIIGWNPSLTFEVERKGEQVTLTSEEVQRNCTTEEKVATLLPPLLNLPTLKGRKEWEQLKKLKEVRDAIVHIKSPDMHAWRDQPTDTIYARFFDTKADQFTQAAFDVIWYFSATELNQHRFPDWILRFK